MRTPWDELAEDLAMSGAARKAWRACALMVIGALAGALVLHLVARQAQAQPIAGTRFAQDAPRVIFDCQQLGAYARRIAMLRDLGAQQVKVIDQLRRELRPGMLLAVLEREVRRVYTEKPSGPEAELSAYRRCQAQLGDMGREG